MSIDPFSLTGFQRDMLYVILGSDRPSGQDIKGELEEYVGEMSHARLYPNLDTLVERGLVEKGQMDRRANYYEITPEGEELIERRQEWETEYIRSG